MSKLINGTLAYYVDMLDRNPSATIGVTLAARMIVAAMVDRGEAILGDDDILRNEIRKLSRKYETMSNRQVRYEMGILQK